MDASQTCRWFKWALLALLALPCDIALAQNDIEDPTVYPGSWYRIVFDSKGNYVRGDGDGYGRGTWYHYPQTGWYRQWFPNGSYDPDRRGYLHYEVYIKAVDPNRPTYVEINFNWATPEWSLRGLDRPPLPEDIQTAADESLYMGTRRLYLVDNWFIGTIEPIAKYTIEDYNPAWVSIDIRGRNACVYRGVMRECRGKEGACCNQVNEDCFLAAEEDCKAPHKWLGPGSTCDQCTQNATWLDFGDAPDDGYQTYLASDGPRHAVVEGVSLGALVDSEQDGRPNESATGDDLVETDDEDGVIFTSSLVPGGVTTLEVTASTRGYLNAWVDFDGNGRFDGTGEQVFSDELLAEGPNPLVFDVPQLAARGPTFARFRFNTRGLLSSNGLAADGEVEDYAVTITEFLEPQINFGKGGIKWSQEPQQFDATTPFIFNGWTEPSGLHLRQVAADDWRCQDDQPITGVQWWGSFEGWKQPLLPQELPLAFHVGIWTDGPRDGDPKSLGHPGALIWETFCTNWSWNVAGYHSDPRVLSDDTCFQFTCLLSQDQWFYPLPAEAPKEGAAETIYWLSIAAVYDPGTSMPRHGWGWTTRPYSFAGGAVRVDQIEVPKAPGVSWPPGVGSQWLHGTPIEDPPAVAWDLAFELLTNQGTPGRDPDLAPVYRFWSDKFKSHFYTISETEKNKLIETYSDAWTYEGVAFYAYPPDRQPTAAKPVYRFWSAKLGYHFYSISEREKDKLLRDYPDVWTFEGVAWYAFD